MKLVACECPPAKATGKGGIWNGLIEDFLKSGSAAARVEDDTHSKNAMRCGLQVAIKRKYHDLVNVTQRGGKIYLVRADADGRAK